MSYLYFLFLCLLKTTTVTSTITATMIDTITTPPKIPAESETSDNLDFSSDTLMTGVFREVTGSDVNVLLQVASDPGYVEHETTSKGIPWI